MLLEIKQAINLALTSETNLILTPEESRAVLEMIDWKQSINGMQVTLDRLSQNLQIMTEVMKQI